MMKLVTLDKDNSIQVKEPVQYFLDPDFIYIPLPDKKEKLKKEKHWKKGSLLYDNLYSPVSGKLVNITKCLLPNGKNVNCLVLANDFQEKNEKSVATRKKINYLTREEVLKNIYSSSLRKKLESEDVTTILVSGIDDEPYIVNESFVQRENTKAILEVIDMLLHIYPNSKAILGVKNTDTATILAYNNFLGTYKNISLKLFPDLYLIGKEEFLTKYLHIRKKYLFLKASDVYALYIYLKKRRPVTEKYITISGNAVSNPIVVCTKYGVKVKDILDRFYKENFSKDPIFVNGVMQGKILDVEKVIVTFDFEGLAIMKKEEKKEKTCIKCGKCIAICPIRSNPLIAYKTGRKVRCIECGLCSYICPSYIPLQNYLSGEEK